MSTLFSRFPARFATVMLMAIAVAIPVASQAKSRAAQLKSLSWKVGQTACRLDSGRTISSSSHSGSIRIVGGRELVYVFNRRKMVRFEGKGPGPLETVTARMPIEAIARGKVRTDKIGTCNVVELACAERDCVDFSVSSPKKKYRFSGNYLDFYLSDTKAAKSFRNTLKKFIAK